MGQNKIDELFEACDVNKSGYIEREELRELCKELHLTDLEFEEIFNELDKDGDGKLGKQDFVQGFAGVNLLFARRKGLRGGSSSTDVSVNNSTSSLNGPGLNAVQAWTKFLNELDLGYRHLSGLR